MRGGSGRRFSARPEGCVATEASRVDSKGEVVGIVSWGLARSLGFVGLNFAVPSEEIAGAKVVMTVFDGKILFRKDR